MKLLDAVRRVLPVILIIGLVRTAAEPLLLDHDEEAILSLSPSDIRIAARACVGRA